MVRGTVQAESSRPLTVVRVGEWGPGGTAMNFRAAVRQGNQLYGVQVKVLSRDKSRVFVKFANGSTGWISVDALREG